MNTAERQETVITKKYEIDNRQPYRVEVHQVRRTAHGLFSIGIIKTCRFSWSDDADKFIASTGFAVVQCVYR